MNRPSTANMFLRSRRSGAAMAVALAVLLVVSLAAAVTLRALLRSHRELRDQQQRLQADLLADSALCRAMARLESDPAWKGETWKVDLRPATTENHPDDSSATTGVAVIQIETIADKKDLQITVEAICPDDPIHRARARRAASFAPLTRKNP